MSIFNQRAHKKLRRGARALHTRLVASKPLHVIQWAWMQRRDKDGSNFGFYKAF